MSNVLLERVIYGAVKSIPGSPTPTPPALVVLATTPNVSAGEAAAWRSLASLQPLPFSLDRTSDGAPAPPAALSDIASDSSPAASSADTQESSATANTVSATTAITLTPPATTSLSPLDIAAQIAATRAYGLFARRSAFASGASGSIPATSEPPGADFALMCAYARDHDPASTLVECVLIPREVFSRAEGNIAPLLAIFRDPIAPGQPIVGPLSPIALNPPPAEAPGAGWSIAARTAAFEYLLRALSPQDESSAITDAQFERALGLFGAALHERGLIFYGNPDDSERRIRLIQGFMTLLPAALRADFTFSTNRHEAVASPARLVFARHGVSSSRWPVDWSALTAPDPVIVETWAGAAETTPARPYLDHLRALWRRAAQANPIDSADAVDPAGRSVHADERTTPFMRAVEQMETAARALSPDLPLAERLRRVAERDALERRAQAGESIPVETLKAAFQPRLDEPGAPRETGRGDNADGVILTGAIKTRFAPLLAEYALTERDADLAVLVARTMDADPQLDEQLWAFLNTALVRQPDAVYAFVRARIAYQLAAVETALVANPTPAMSAAAEVNGTPTDTAHLPIVGLPAIPTPALSPEWLRRLHAAALAALRVVIRRGDPEPLIAWLKLIAREPAAYGLGDILHWSILASAERARERLLRLGVPQDPTLARSLVLLAVKRDLSAATTLLEDDTLVRALPDALQAALLEGEGDPATLLNTYGADLLMFVLARTAERQQPALFTPYAVERVWEMWTALPASIAASPGQVSGQAASTSTPPAIILNLGSGMSATCGLSSLDIVQRWEQHGIGWMANDAQTRLLALTLSGNRPDLFTRFARSLAAHPDASEGVNRALEMSNRSGEEAARLITSLHAPEGWSAQQTLDLNVALFNRISPDGTPPPADAMPAGDPASVAARLNARISPAAAPVATGIARLIQQNPALTVPSEVAWRLLRAAVAENDEALIRAWVRRLESDLAAQPDDALLIAQLGDLAELLTDHPEVWARLIPWWRGWVRGLPAPRLSRLEKSFDGRRGLDDLRHITSSAAAFHRLLGKRTLGQLADDVATTYAVMEALNEAFEPLARRASAFDAPLLRAELDARRGELPPDAWQVFASNLKELAELIADLGDSRSKATLIRRGEDIDRQLATGEQTPHSAVDALKWLAGYLSGAQHPEDER